MRTESLAPDLWHAATHAELLRQAQSAADPEQAWLHLEAAHVVGQLRLWPHTVTHMRMLRLALRQGNALEAAGQLLRLAMVPLGHLSGRLPLGNPGRSTVSAFAPLPVRPELQALIERARAEVLP